MTDALQVIAENTTHFLGMKDMIDYGRTMNKRWIDVIEKPLPEKSEEPEDNRPSEEIASDIWKRIRGH